MRLSWHLQQHDQAIIDIVNEAKPEFVKLMLYEDQTIANPFDPCIKVIGRVWVGGDDVERDYIAQGEHGGMLYHDRLVGFYERHPWVHAFESANEPSVATEDESSLLSDFTAAWAAQMRKAHRKTVGLNLSVGWPTLELGWQLEWVATRVDYIGVHEYGGPRMWEEVNWHCLRYRQALLRFGVPILIGECGIDGGVIGQPRKGWKTFATRGEYWDQLRWYNRELERDPLVKAAFIFTSGPTDD